MRLARERCCVRGGHWDGSFGCASPGPPEPIDVVDDARCCTGEQIGATCEDRLRRRKRPLAPSVGSAVEVRNVSPSLPPLCPSPPCRPRGQRCPTRRPTVAVRVRDLLRLQYPVVVGRRHAVPDCIVRRRHEQIVAVVLDRRNLIKRIGELARQEEMPARPRSAQRPPCSRDRHVRLES